MQDRLSQAQLDLDTTKAEVERLRLRVGNRNLPYYQVIQEFFPKELANFVEEAHTCKCNICGKEPKELLPLCSTEQSSNPQQLPP